MFLHDGYIYICVCAGEQAGWELRISCLPTLDMIEHLSITIHTNQHIIGHPQLLFMAQSP